VSRINRAVDQLHAKSVAFVEGLDEQMRRIMLLWTMAASFACGLRITVTSPRAPFVENLVALAPYMLVVGAPVASLMLAFHWFRDGEQLGQPGLRIARFGRWQSIGLTQAQTMSLYGSSGLMASLMLGILINVPMRSLEFLAAVPEIATRPLWLGTLSTMMLADVVLLSSLYCVAFVAALRRVPLFPRLLGIVWATDILMQGLILQLVQVSGPLPASVEPALHGLVSGNVKKVLISIAIWLPYLILSKRVNLTFRHRIPG
jgi:hypothetical protein